MPLNNGRLAFLTNAHPRLSVSGGTNNSLATASITLPRDRLTVNEDELEKAVRPLLYKIIPGLESFNVKVIWIGML